MATMVNASVGDLRYRYEFLLFFRDLCRESDELPRRAFEEDNLRILEDCTFVPGANVDFASRIGSDREPSPFLEYLALLSTLRGGKEKAKPPEDDPTLELPGPRIPQSLAAKPELQAAHKRYQKRAAKRRPDAKRNSRRNKRAGQEAEEKEEDSGSDSGNQSDDSDKEAVWAAYREDQEAWVQEGKSLEDFVLTVPGGLWAAESLGRATAGMQGVARSRLAKEFVQKSGEQATFFTPTDLYTYEECAALVNAWCQRMNWL